MKSLESIARRLRPECFDPVYKGHHPVIPASKEKVFFHSGDFGDIVYALPTIRALGGGKLLIGPSRQWKTRLQMTPEHVETLRPLLALQPYIKGVGYCDKAPPDAIDLNRFRECLLLEQGLLHGSNRRLNLAEAHLYAYRLAMTECDRPWLEVDRMEPVPGRPVLIHRSSRWRCADFPWDKVMRRHGHQAAFVGLPEEHAEFVKEWGSLPHVPTANFLELARLIAGCWLYIGNQSLPYAICEGLKHLSVLEVWPEGPNCNFRRKNAIYGDSKAVHIPSMSTAMNTTVTACPSCAGDAATAPRFRDSADIVQCPACHLVYLRTRPDEEATMLYYQQYADDHSHMRLPKDFDEVRSSGLRREYFMQELLAYCKPVGNMLDIGCGWGAFLVNAREKGFTPFGVDVCSKAASFASSILGIPVQCDDSAYDGFSAGMFSSVVAIHSLEHMARTSVVLKHIRRVLQSGGFFCGIVPNIGSFCSTTLKDRWQWLDSNTHYVHFSPDTLRHMLENHGFEVVKMSTHTGDYDERELRRLVAESTASGPDSERANQFIRSLWENGQGEEIRFFAKAL